MKLFLKAVTIFVWFFSTNGYSYLTNYNFEIELERVHNDQLFQEGFFLESDANKVTKEIAFKDGRTKTYRFPSFYGNVDYSSAIFLARSKKIPLPDHLYPVSILPGRTLVVVNTYRYNSVRGMTPYNEAAIVVPVSENPLAKIPLTGLLGGIKKLKFFVIKMPVTSEENLQRGHYFWGLDKVARNIIHTQENGAYSSSLHTLKGEFDFSLTVPTEGKTTNIQTTRKLAIDEAFGGNVAYNKFKGTVNQRLFPKSASITFGSGPIGVFLRSVLVGQKPILTQFGQGLDSAFTLPGQKF